MPPPNSKTVTLARGRHRSPREGVCVMELASMLAGEAFTDQPLTVAPTIAARADRRRREAVEVLAAAVVERVVVRAQHGRDHRADRARVVGERLAGEHRGELHDAGAGVRRGMPAGAEAYRLVAWLVHRLAPLLDVSFRFVPPSASPLPLPDREGLDRRRHNDRR